MEVKVVIPSHKRSDRVLTTQVVPNAIVCVPESQADLYRAANPDTELVLHPDYVIGLAPKRQWIYEHFGNVLMLDDDITDFRKVYIAAGQSGKVDTATTWALIQECAYCAKAAGSFLFGFNFKPNPTTFKPFSPIRRTGYVTGCAIGLLAGSKLWFNSEIVCNEDYWISLLNAYHHRTIWRDNRFVFIQKDTFASPGGMAEFRNIEVEEEDFKKLKKWFGNSVELKKATKLAGLKHPFQKSLNLPF